jgi:folylpolyglutamate synthase/dihydropteroate synthase
MIIFFEMSVGLAFSYFEQEQVDISIIEVEWAEDWTRQML